MIVQACNCVVVWSTVKHFSNLLQKALSIELCCTHEGIFSEKYMLTFKSCVETKNVTNNIIELTSRLGDRGVSLLFYQE